MGVRMSSVYSKTSLGNVPASGADTVIIATPPLILPLPASAVFIEWLINTTVGAGSTAMQVSVRRGATTAGTRINGANNLTVVAAQVISVQGGWVDDAGLDTETQYCISIAGTGTTGAWATFDVFLQAYVF